MTPLSAESLANYWSSTEVTVNLVIFLNLLGALVGVGFYPAAILLAVLSASCMMWMSSIEGALPSHEAIAITLRFRAGQPVQAEWLRAASLSEHPNSPRNWRGSKASRVSACRGRATDCRVRSCRHAAWRCIALPIRQANSSASPSA